MYTYTVPREKASPALTVSRETKERGERLAKEREGAGLRQVDLAAELHAAKLLPSPRYQTVSDWELGLAEPSLEQLTWLRERFGFDWGWFFSGKEAEKELAAYRRVVRVVLETEGLTRLGDLVADGIRKEGRK